jgi:phage tail tape-measure protein
MTNSREDEETEDAKAKSHAEVMRLITKITEDTPLAMTAEIEEMVETLRAKVGIGIWDTGCRKTVAGATWIKTYVQALAGLGYTAEFAACTEKFKF